jgi:hypothetical protein
MNWTAAVEDMLEAIELPRQRPWREIGAGCLLVLEVAWLIPWYAWLAPSAQEVPKWQILALLLLVAILTAYLRRAGRWFGLAAPQRRLLLLLALLLAVVTGLQTLSYRDMQLDGFDALRSAAASLRGPLIPPPESLVTMLVILYAWWRGLIISGMGVLDSVKIGLRFRLGVLYCMGFAIFIRDDRTSWLVDILPFYFASAMLAMAFARADGLSQVRGAGRPPFSLAWLGALLALAGMIAGLGRLGDLVLHSPAAQFGGRIVQGLLRLLLDVILLAVLAAQPLFAWLSPVFEWLVGWIDGLMRGMMQPASPLDQPPAVGGPSGGELLPPVLPDGIQAILEFLRLNLPVFRAIGIATAMFVLIVLALRASRHIQAIGRLPLEDDTHALSIRPGWSSSLIHRLQTLGGYALSWRDALLGSHLLAGIVIRRIYADLLAMGRAHGRARRSAETPNEYLPALVELFPDHRQELSIITQAYNAVRYGQHPEEAGMVRKVQQSWSTLRSASGPAS